MGIIDHKIAGFNVNEPSLQVLESIFVIPSGNLGIIWSQRGEIFVPATARYVSFRRLDRSGRTPLI
jgi:hypothetical protein